MPYREVKLGSIKTDGFFVEENKVKFGRNGQVSIFFASCKVQSAGSYFL
jgi:hypothetical protein